MSKKDIEILCKILKKENRDNLASLLEGSLGELEQTSQYGSYWNSVVSYYNIYLDLDNFFKIKNIQQEDRQHILDALLIIYPHGEGKPEISSLEFLLLKDYPLEVVSEEKVREKKGDIIPFEHEADIKYQFLLEQIKKAREKYQNNDFDGALTNVRTSVEAATFDIYKRITGLEIIGSGSLKEDYGKVKMLLNLAPEKKTNNASKKMVSSFISAIDAIDELANEMGDRHLRKVIPSSHHVAFCINASTSVLNFLYSSLIYQYREKDNIYSELIKIMYKDSNRFSPKDILVKNAEIKFIYDRCDFFTKNILKNKLVAEFEVNHFKDSDVFFCFLNLFSETLTKEDVTNINKKYFDNSQACGLKKFNEEHPQFFNKEDIPPENDFLSIDEAQDLGII